MFSEDKITELFCLTDNYSKEFIKYQENYNKNFKIIHPAPRFGTTYLLLCFRKLKKQLLCVKKKCIS